MSQFWSPTYHHLTDADLDWFAINNKPIDSYGGTYKCHPKADALRSEHYTLRIVGTKGLGNSGIVYLAGKSPHGRRMVREGKIRSLMAEGCPREVAEFAIRCKWGMEVWKLAVDLVPLLKHGIELRAIHSNAEFERVTGIKTIFSFPRKSAAIELAEKIVDAKIKLPWEDISEESLDDEASHSGPSL
jgi:hypothetical protein